MLPSTWHKQQANTSSMTHRFTHLQRWLLFGPGAIMTIIKLFLPFPPLFRRGVKVVSDIRYATESTKTSQPQDADTQPGWAKLPPMGSIWGVKIQSLLLTLRGAGFSDGLQHLDVYYKPHNADMNNKLLPVLMYVHGGAWSTLDKAVVMVPMLRALADSDRVVVVSVNYRLAPETIWPGQLIDAKRALVWVRKNIHTYGGDPQHIVVGGESAGGQIAAMITLTQNRPVYQPGFEVEDTRVSGCVDISSPHNLVCRNSFSTRWLSEGAERVLLQKSFAKHRKRFEEASPHYVLNDIPAIAFSPPCPKCNAKADPNSGVGRGPSPFTEPLPSSRKNRFNTQNTTQTRRRLKLRTAPTAAPPLPPPLASQGTGSGTRMATLEVFPAIPPFLVFCTQKDVMIPVEDMKGFYERLKSRRGEVLPQSCAACSARRPKDAFIDVPDGYHSFGYFMSPRAEGLAATVLSFIRYTVHYKSLLMGDHISAESKTNPIQSKL